MTNFTVPYAKLTTIAIEQAAANNAIIVIPNFYDDYTIQSIKEKANDLGLTYSDGYCIEVYRLDDYKSLPVTWQRNSVVVMYPSHVLESEMQLYLKDGGEVIAVEPNN